MAKIEAINTNIQQRQPLTPEERKQRQEQVATGVGGAAGLSTQATRMAGKRGLNANAARNAEHQLQNMMEQTQRAMQNVNQNSQVAIGLWANFKSNIKFYTNDIIKRLESLKNTKFIGPIVNSPVTKKLAGAAGGALAFFVLVTGVNKAVKTGAIAVDDFKSQYNDFRTAA